MQATTATELSGEGTLLWRNCTPVTRVWYQAPWVSLIRGTNKQIQWSSLLSPTAHIPDNSVVLIKTVLLVGTQRCCVIGETCSYNATGANQFLLGLTPFKPRESEWEKIRHWQTRFQAGTRKLGEEVLWATLWTITAGLRWISGKWEVLCSWVFISKMILLRSFQFNPRNKQLRRASGDWKEEGKDDFGRLLLRGLGP